MAKARPDKTLRGLDGEWPSSEPPLSSETDNTSQCQALEEPADRAMRENKDAFESLLRTCRLLQEKEQASRVVVLLVEDDSGVQRALKRVLQSTFARVDLAQSYTEAVLRLSRNAYDVVIADYRLSNDRSAPTGADVIRWMRDHNGVHSDTPAILISGDPVLLDEAETGLAQQASGADLYLEKGSFTNADLITHVQRLTALG